MRFRKKRNVEENEDEENFTENPETISEQDSTEQIEEMHRALMNNNPSMNNTRDEDDEFVPRNQRYSEDHLNRCLATTTPDEDEAISFLTRKDVPSSQKKEAILYRNDWDYNALDFAYDFSLRLIKLLAKYGGAEAINSVRDGDAHILTIFCANVKSFEFIKVLAEAGGKEAVVHVTQEENQNPNALAFAAIYKQWASVKLLAEIGEKEAICAPDRYGETSLHRAIRAEAPFEVIETLLHYGGKEAANALNNAGNNALHIASFTNPPTSILGSLIETAGVESFVVENSKSDTPLEKFYTGSAPIELILFMQNKWIAKDPRMQMVSEKIVTSTMEWVQNLPRKDRASALKCLFIKKMLNESFVKSKFMNILMTDFYVQLMTVLIFSIGIGNSLNGSGQSIDTFSQTCLTISIIWFVTREFMQIVTTPLRFYLMDFGNLLDSLQIFFVAWSLKILNGGIETEREQRVVAITTGVVWILLIMVFKDLNYQIAVFVVALQKIVLVLVPFMFTTSLIVSAFAHMFYATNAFTSKCTDMDSGTSDWTCSISDSYFRSYTMLLAGEWEFLGDDSSAGSFNTGVAFTFAIVVGIFLLNILIAEISNVFTAVVENGRNAFWTSRLTYMSEINSIINNIIGVFNNNVDDDNAALSKEDTKDSSVGDGMKSNTRFSFAVRPSNYDVAFNRSEQEEFYDWWYDVMKGTDVALCPPWRTRYNYYFNNAKFTEIFIPGREMERIIYGFSKKDNSIWTYPARLTIYLLFPLVPLACIIAFLVGLLTFGNLWPFEMKKFFFFGPLQEEEDGDDDTDDMKASLAEMNLKLKKLEESIELEKSMKSSLEEIRELLEKSHG